MLGPAGLWLLAGCLVSQCSARLSVAVRDRDYSYAAGPSEELVSNMKNVLSRNTAEQAAHPRLQRLYALLRRDLCRSTRQDQCHSRHQVLDVKTLRSKYDVNKLNRVYSTEAPFVAR